MSKPHARYLVTYARNDKMDKTGFIDQYCDGQETCGRLHMSETIKLIKNGFIDQYFEDLAHDSEGYLCQKRMDHQQVTVRLIRWKTWMAINSGKWPNGGRYRMEFRDMWAWHVQVSQTPRSNGSRKLVSLSNISTTTKRLMTGYLCQKRMGHLATYVGRKLTRARNGEKSQKIGYQYCDEQVTIICMSLHYIINYKIILT